MENTSIDDIVKAELIRRGWTPPTEAGPVVSKQTLKGETVGARVKRLRTGLGLSQRQLAEPGVSYAFISRIEADARVPSVKALRKIAPKLGVTVEYLETGIDHYCPNCGVLLP